MNKKLLCGILATITALSLGVVGYSMLKNESSQGSSPTIEDSSSSQGSNSTIKDSSASQGSSSTIKDSSFSHTHYFEWSVMIQATCTQKGVSKGVCHCGYQTIEEIPEIGHTYKNNTCIVCGDEIELSESLAYTISNDRSYYIVSGIGTYTKSDVIIPAIYKDLPVKEIGEYAFQDCTNLTTITIPNVITSIKMGAFSKCTNLTSVLFEECSQLASIGDAAFGVCRNLTKITIPKTVNSIGLATFGECISLENILVEDGNTAYHAEGNCLIETQSKTLIAGCKNSLIPTNGSVTSIGDCAFMYCNNLISISIPNSVTSLGMTAFAGCINLTSIIIPNSVTSIAYGTFGGCSNLTSVIFEKDSQLASLGESSFDQCANLTSITIPNSLTSIGKSAFNRCNSLASIAFEEKGELSFIGENAFYGCNNLTSIHIVDLETWCKISFENYYSTPLIYTPNLYLNGKLITNLIIPDSITKIQNYAFRGCSSLTSITIPNSITSIGEETFYNCNNLTSVTIPTSVTLIGKSAFFGCNDLTSITLPFIGNQANGTTNTHFGYIFGASSYYEHRNTNYIPTNLKEVIITGNSPIGDNAFSFLYNLTSVTIGDSVTSIGQSAFTGCRLSSITIPNSVTSIGRYAFSSCTDLTSITLPFVGNQPNGTINTNFGYIFGANTGNSNNDHVPTSLKEVIITGGTFIDENAFIYCKNLTSITLPNSITSIGTHAFSRCDSLTSLNFEENSQLTFIDEYAFSASNSLTSITIPNSVTSIGYGAFYNCNGLRIMTLPFVGHQINGTTNTHFGYIFGAETTYENDDYVPAYLYELIITNSTSIGYGAFAGCDKLTYVDLAKSNKLTSIGEQAFNGCSELTSISIPDSVTSMDALAFRNCNNLIGVYITDLEAWCKVSFDGDLSNPLYYATNLYLKDELVTNLLVPETITEIKESTFSGCSNLTSVTIPNSVTSIGEWAFSNCNSLTSVVIPDSVTSIGDAAFYKCNNLASITLPFIGSQANGTANTHFGYIFGAHNGSYNNDYIPTNLKEVIITNATLIDEDAFSGCSSLTSITIPNSVTSIGEWAFSNCNSLTSITIPDSVTSIGDSAFSNCNSLTSITIPESVTTIGDDAFWNCDSLTSVVIPDSVTTIGEYAFYSCDSLTSVVIPDSVTTIGDDAFWNCYSLTSVVIPDSVTTIGEYAFYSCDSLTSVVIGDSVTSIGDYAFDWCTSLTSVVIGDSVTTIGDYAFRYCTSLTSVVIPDSVTTIGDDAFGWCDSLTSVVIGDSVTTIGDYAFRGCNSLTSIYYKGAAEDWAKISIHSSNNSYLTDATRYYYSESKPTQEGNFWHYDENGNVVVW